MPVVQSTLTVALRGDAEVMVEVRTLEEARNSGTFGGAAPVMRIKTPCVLDVYTEDCFAGRVQSADDFGDIPRRKIAVAGIFALGAVREEEILARDQP